MAEPTDNANFLRASGLLIPDGASLYGLLAISLLLHLLPDQIQWQLQLHLKSETAFQYWQVFTAHFVHISWQHLLGNGICLVVLQQVYGRCFSSLSWLYAVVFLVVFVSAGLIFLSVELHWYAGLSAIVLGIACYAAVIDKHYKLVFNVLVISALGVYSGIFLLQGEVSAGLGLVPVASFSHILGIICGVFLGGVVRINRTRKLHSQTNTTL
ncbi:MAG: rhomboid family intramembrane serine protease [Halioglobus sp.]